MANALRLEIERWFDCQRDGEFIRLPHGTPFSVSDPTPDSSFILFTTKPAATEVLVERYFGQRKPGVVGGYGLPYDDHVAWLRDYISDRTLIFLGDCDPPDILIFAWLRFYIEIWHFGVNDALVSKLQVPVAENSTIKLSESESQAVALLERLCPDYRTVIESECVALLGRKRKLEVEALVSFATADGPVLDAALPT